MPLLTEGSGSNPQRVAVVRLYMLVYKSGNVDTSFDYTRKGKFIVTLSVCFS